MARSFTAEAERAAFTSRLATALCGAGYPHISNVALVREFNARSQLPPLSVHAVRKWVVGESIPSQERLLVLASWLAVSHAWLRYGDELRVTASLPAYHQSAEDASLLLDIKRLDSGDLNLVRELVNLLLNTVEI